ERALRTIRSTRRHGESPQIHGVGKNGSAGWCDAPFARQPFEAVCIHGHVAQQARMRRWRLDPPGPIVPDLDSFEMGQVLPRGERFDVMMAVPNLRFELKLLKSIDNRDALIPKFCGEGTTGRRVN